jgi:hypothetical protein
MGPSGSLSWWEKVSFSARVRHRLRSGTHRLRSVWWQIVQTAVAAIVAWFLAVLILGHERPAFAPIAAVISLGLAVGERSKRVVELTLGVALGVAIGDFSCPSLVSERYRVGFWWLWRWRLPYFSVEEILV